MTIETERHALPAQWAVILIFAGTSLVLVVNVGDSTILKPPLLYIMSALLAAGWISRSLGQVKFDLTLSPMHLAMLAYIALSSLSLLNAVNIKLGMTSIAGLICYFIVFAACAELSNESRSLERVARSFSVVTVLACFIGIVQIFLGSRSQALLIPQDRGTTSTFGNVTYFAGFLAPMLPILISQFVISRRASHRVMLGLLGLLMVYLLITTESRSGWAGAVAGILILTLLIFRSARTRWTLLGCLLVAGILLVVAFPGMIQHRLLGIFESGPSSSIVRRLYFYRGAWKAFLNSPLFGQGVGNFSLFLPKFREPSYWMARSEDIVPHAHNEFLEILSETGIVGFVSFLIVLFLYARSVVRGLRGAVGENRLLLAGLASGVVAILVDNLASMNLRTVPVAVTFWMITGLSLRLSASKLYPLTISLPSVVRRTQLTPYLVFGLFLLWYVPRVWNSYIAQRYGLEGDLLRFQNKSYESGFKYADALRHDPDLAEARLYLAAELAHESRYQAARRYLDTLLMRCPYYPKARFIMAISAFEMGDTAAALMSIDDELKIENSPQTLYIASNLERATNHPDREYEDLRALLTNSVRSGLPEYAAEGIDQLTPPWSHMSKNRDCAGLVAEIRRAFPRDVKLLATISRFYEQTGILGEAESTLVQALALQPENEDLRTRLTHVRQDRTGDKHVRPK